MIIISIQHSVDKLIWVCTSWSKFLLVMICITEITGFVTDILEDGTTMTIRRRLQTISKRYLQMKNKKNAKEKLLFPCKKLWTKADKIDDEEKYKKAIAYVLDGLACTISNQNDSVLYRLINLIFYNKI